MNKELQNAAARVMVVTGAGSGIGHAVVQAALAARGITSAHLSLTHDAGVACAFVVLEGDA